MITFGSLFAGIGGIDLGLERAGMAVRWQVELDEFATRILVKHWPGVPKFRDVREVGAHNHKPVDLIAGGFPCQDISVAGKGAGLDGDRSGLWFEFLRVVQELRPAWVLAENVPALRTQGADVVLDGLAEAGYSAWPLVVGARHVGASHRRDRVWIVAHAAGSGRDAQPLRGSGAPEGHRGAAADVAGSASSVVGHAAGAGRGAARGAVDARARGAGALDEPARAGERLAYASDESERRRGAGYVAGATRAPEADGAERERLRDSAGDCGATGVGQADSSQSGLEGFGARAVSAGAQVAVPACCGHDCDVAHSHGHGREGEWRGGLLDSERQTQRNDLDRRDRWPSRPGEQQYSWEEPRTTESEVGSPVDGLSRQLARSASRHRRNSLKALGNSVVPAVVECIGRAIMEVAA